MKKLILLACLFAVPVHAALFEDTDARKKLQEMQLKETELDARIVSLEAVIKSGSLNDMLNQIELIKQDVSKLRGDLETLRHLNATVEQRQKDLYQDLDGRLRKMEEKSVASNPVPSGKVTEAPPLPEVKPPSDQEIYDEANQLLEAMKYKEAFQAFTDFIKQFPHSALLPDAKYALANTQFSLKNYKASLGTYQKLLDQHPDFIKNPEALLGLANAQIQLALIPEAKKSLKDLIKKYPKSDVIQNAQKRLKVLESIKP
ncbi:tol-pal system protein YbgF [Candidatus Methylopumilus rimovensis]|uniref:Cell division coordinator CpoB n=1 Tax=Candidatus Methylopumilus rimovensis TaxID=2588535 RepID=A0AAE6FSB3_9PROT|nr:tol-pal system protein YbgF [Candidatus Methylopumilus rimovensis]QDD13057.1 tol-pal system protein YbgF [Candidatus Methylopumilus rimovensis]